MSGSNKDKDNKHGRDALTKKDLDDEVTESPGNLESRTLSVAHPTNTDCSSPKTSNYGGERTKPSNYGGGRPETAKKHYSGVISPLFRSVGKMSATDKLAVGVQSSYKCPINAQEKLGTPFYMKSPQKPQSFSHGALGASAYTQSPMGQQSYTHQPLEASAYTQSPMGQQSYTHQPFEASPYTQSQMGQSSAHETLESPLNMSTKKPAASTTLEERQERRRRQELRTFVNDWLKDNPTIFFMAPLRAEQYFGGWQNTRRYFNDPRKFRQYFNRWLEGVLYYHMLDGGRQFNYRPHGGIQNANNSLLWKDVRDVVLIEINELFTDYSLLVQSLASKEPKLRKLTSESNSARYKIELSEFLRSLKIEIEKLKEVLYGLLKDNGKLKQENGYEEMMKVFISTAARLSNWRFTVFNFHSEYQTYARDHPNVATEKFSDMLKFFIDNEVIKLSKKIRGMLKNYILRVTPNVLM